MTTPRTEPHRSNGAGPAAGPAPTAEELRAEIVATRAALAGTAEALAERLDVPARLKASIRHSRVLRDRGTLVAMAIAVAGTTVAIWAWRRPR